MFDYKTTNTNGTEPQSMKESIKERLLKFIESRSLSVRRFEIECGFPNAYVSNMKRTMTPQRIDALSKRFPELNIVWLMTGNGEMLNTCSASHKAQPATEPERCFADMNERLIGTFDEFVRHETSVSERYLEHINRLTEAYNHTLSMLKAERADAAALIAQMTRMQEHNERIQQQNQQLIDMLKELMAGKCDDRA